MKTKLIYLLCALAFFCACDDIIEKNTPENVFEVFWRTLDENYVFFEEKGIDWDSIYSIYAPQAQKAKGDDDLERIFGEIIPLFKDKHLSVKGIRYLAPEDTNGVFYGWPRDFNRIPFEANPYLCAENSEKRMAYVGISTFQYDDVLYDKMTSNPEKALSTLEYSNGLIIDLRRNGGGELRYLKNFVSSFYTSKKILYYHQNKSGKGHNDFGNKIPITVQGKGYISDSIPIVILTSSWTYSAANLAVYMLKEIRQCTVIGAATGGGGGGRRDVLLPNGWMLSFPCNKGFSPLGKNTEYRLEPDISVKYDSGTRDDSVCIRAIEFLENLQKNK